MESLRDAEIKGIASNFEELNEGDNDMAMPKYHEIYNEILTAVADGKTHDIESVRTSVARQKGVSDEERLILLASGTRPVFDDRVGWARTYLKAAELIEYPSRGKTCITSIGKALIESNPPRIDNDYLEQYDSFKEFRARSKSGEKVSDAGTIEDMSTPTERMQSAFAEINDSLADELLAEIMSQSPTFFEQAIIKLLVKMGYGGGNEGAGIVTPASGDGGIDGIIREDKLGFSNIYVQAKRYDRNSTVGRPEIQKFIGAIAEYKNKKGLFVTTAKFTGEAKRTAEASQIVLIDGERLAKLMIEYGVGVSTVQTLEIKRVDSDFFSE
jgi:restriction system protein